MKALTVPLVATLIIFIIAFATAFVVFADIDSLLILRLGSQQGADFLGTRAEVFELLAAGLVIALVNFALAFFLNRREHFTALLLSFFNVFFAGLILLGLSAIVANN